MPDAVADRLAALQQMSPEQLAALLHEVPGLADAVEHRGPLRSSYEWLPRPRAALDLHGLARMLAGAAAIDSTIGTLDRPAWFLAVLAAWHGGRLTRDEALIETGGAHGDALDAAACTLHTRLLADPALGWVVLRPGVTAMVPVPGVPIAEDLRHRSSGELGTLISALGGVPPARKAERAEAVLRALRDPEVVHRVIDAAGDDARRVFGLLCEHGPQRLPDLGVPYLSPWSRYSSDSPVERLFDTGVVGVDFEAQVCFVWLDVLVALRGGTLYGGAWDPRPREARTAPLAAAPSALPPVLERLDALLRHWQASPAEALASGGLGVRSVRSAAKALGRSPGEVGLLAHIAAALGLLGTAQVGVTGRGRTRKSIQRWTATDLAATFAAEPAARRWALLVQTWRDDAALDESEGLPERREVDRFTVPSPRGTVARTALLRLLAGLPEGTGLPAEELDDAVADRLPALLDPGLTGGVVAGLRVLGLVPPEGPVGLTALGRAVGEGLGAVEAVLPVPRHEVVVQGDLTVLAPPDAAPEVTAALHRYADLESAAGARIYRLSEDRIAAAVDAGESADDVLAWLTEHSSVPVAQNVEYLVRDVARRHGRLRSGTASSYLRSDDTGLLARATAVKAAKLHLLAPTVAVSSLGRERLLAALRSGGVTAVAEDASGATEVRGTPAADPVGGGSQRLPPLLEPADPMVLATRLAQPPTLALDDADDPLARLEARQRMLDAREWDQLADRLRAVGDNEEW